MKFLSDSYWNDLPIPDYRGRFFVELYWELLSKDTPHFYQARLMNTISSLDELIEAIHLFKENEKNLSALTNASRETISVLNFDDVIKRLYSKEVKLLLDILKNIEKESIEKQDLRKIILISNKILACKERYLNELQSELKSSLTSTLDLSQKERVLLEIQKTTSIYVSSLLSEGYSPTYLYNRMEYLTRHNNYGARDFSQQLNSIISKLDNKKRSYRVYFAVKTNKKETLLKNEHLHNLTFVSKIPEDLRPAAEDAFRNFTSNLYATAEINGQDYIGAAWEAKDIIDKSLDYILTKSPRINIAICEHCFSVYKAGGHIYKQNINIDLLIKFLSHDPHINLDETHSHSSIKSNLTEGSFEHLSRSLRYLRLGRESVSLEQKLLNIWIAMESLFIDLNSKNIIDRILDFVPRAYAYETLLKRSSYVLKLLSKHKISIPESLKSDLGVSEDTFSSSVSKIVFHNTLMIDGNARKLFESIENSEHLKFRIKSVYDEIKNIKSIKARLNKTEKDVSMQLRRLYLYRNKIAHAGYLSGIRPQLINNLVDYLMVCYKAIFVTLASIDDDRKFTVSDSILSYSTGINIKDKELEAVSFDISHDNLLVMPAI